MLGLAMLRFGCSCFAVQKNETKCRTHLDQLQDAIMVGALLVWHLEPRTQQGEVKLCRKWCGREIIMRRGRTAGRGPKKMRGPLLSTNQ